MGGWGRTQQNTIDCLSDEVLFRNWVVIYFLILLGRNGLYIAHLLKEGERKHGYSERGMKKSNLFKNTDFLPHSVKPWFTDNIRDAEISWSKVYKSSNILSLSLGDFASFPEYCQKQAASHGGKLVDFFFCPSFLFFNIICILNSACNLSMIFATFFFVR